MKESAMLRIRGFAALLTMAPLAAAAEPVPKFVGMQLEEAQAAASASQITLEYEMVDSVERKGMVIKQIPSPGSEIGSERAVWLRSSKGRTVPNLVARMRDDALATLIELGLTARSTESRHDGGVRGAVWSQIPPAGTAIDAATQVVFLDLVGGRYVTVPDVSGKLLSEAIQTIKNGELAPREDPADESYVNNSIQDVRHDCTGITRYTATVTETVPAAGTEVYPATDVQVKHQKTSAFLESNECPPPEPRMCIDVPC